MAKNDTPEKLMNNTDWLLLTKINIVIKTPKIYRKILNKDHLDNFLQNPTSIESCPNIQCKQRLDKI